MKQNKPMKERKALDRQVKKNGVPMTDTEYQLSGLGYMTKAQLIEEILGSFSWDYLMENGLVAPRDGLKMFTFDLSPPESLDLLKED